MRPVDAGDRQLLVEGLERLSTKSQWLRFMRPVSHLSERELTYLTELDYSDHSAWAALTVDEPPMGIGVARFLRRASLASETGPCRTGDFVRRVLVCLSKVTG